MIEYPVIIVYQALSSDVAKKKKNFGGFTWEMVRSECNCPSELSMLQYKYLAMTLSKKVGKALKIAGKLREFAFKRI